MKSNLLAKAELCVFVSGPMTAGLHYERNIRLAMDAAALLMANGFHPFVPHLYTLLEMVHHQDYDRWLALDFAFVERCHALLRLPGESKGADLEVAHAKELGRPVFYTIESLIEWRNVLQASM